MHNVVHLGDCMDGMTGKPDNYYDLAVVDPPYGIARFSSRIDPKGWNTKKGINSWDKKPGKMYFSELFRVSNHQIIWGMNNFILPETEYFIVWNKRQTVKNFASAEIAWTNIKQPALVFDYSIHKMMYNQKKIHPTQKPVALYKWLLKNYAKPGWKILDTHVGSGSSRIAAYDMGFWFEGWELDPDYYVAQEERFQNHIKQVQLFDDKEKQEIVYKQMEF